MALKCIWNVGNGKALTLLPPYDFMNSFSKAFHAIYWGNNKIIVDSNPVIKCRSLAKPSYFLCPCQAPGIDGQAIRSIFGRENCEDNDAWPPCTSENIEKRSKIKQPQNVKGKPTIYQAYWKQPNLKCCTDACQDAFPRFDDLYYKEKNKTSAKYTQTWNSTPVCGFVKRGRFPFDKIQPPPFTKRNKRATSAERDVCDDQTYKCQKLKLAECPSARKGTCQVEHHPSPCRKLEAPVKSFGDHKKKFEPTRLRECWYIAIPTMCQVWREWRRLYTHITTGKRDSTKSKGRKRF